MPTLNRFKLPAQNRQPTLRIVIHHLPYTLLRISVTMPSHLLTAFAALPLPAATNLLISIITVIVLISFTSYITAPAAQPNNRRSLPLSNTKSTEKALAMGYSKFASRKLREGLLMLTLNIRWMTAGLASFLIRSSKCRLLMVQNSVADSIPVLGIQQHRMQTQPQLDRRTICSYTEQLTGIVPGRYT